MVAKHKNVNSAMDWQYVVVVQFSCHLQLSSDMMKYHICFSLTWPNLSSTLASTRIGRLTELGGELRIATVGGYSTG